MKKALYSTVLTTLILSSNLATAANEQSLKNEISLLKNRINKLETILNTKVSEDKARKEIESNKTNNNLAILSFDNGPKFTSANGEMSMEINGKINTDFAFLLNDKSNENFYTSLRVAEVGFKGSVTKDFDYNLKIDFAKNNSNVKNAYIQYNGFKPFKIRLGRFSHDFGLQDEGTFLESPASKSLIPELNNGIKLSTNGSNWHISTSVALNNYGMEQGEKQQQRAFYGRGVFAPINEGNKLVHIGASAFYRAPTKEKTTTFKFTEISETKFVPNIISTNEITNVKNVIVNGLEIAAKNGPLSFQGEYIISRLRKEKGFKNDKFKGGYAQVAYTLTGEERGYDITSGELTELKPTNPFTLNGKGLGAWEVAFRYSDVNLNSETVKAGKMSIYTVGLNWYLNKNFKLMTDFSVVKTKDTAIKKDPKIIAIRGSIKL